MAFQLCPRNLRVAHYNLCTILMLTSEKAEDRLSALKLRDLFRKMTLDMKTNACEFDKTTREKKLEANPLRKNADPA